MPRLRLGDIARNASQLARPGRQAPIGLGEDGDIQNLKDAQGVDEEQRSEPALVA